MITLKKPNRSAFLMICVVFFTGCAHLWPPLEDDAFARRVLQRLEDNNSGLTQFKALGHIRMESEEGTQSGRVAMASVVPGKLRADWLNMMGQPLASVAGDGETISIWSPTDSKVHRLPQSSNSLAKLIHIPTSQHLLQDPSGFQTHPYLRNRRPLFRPYPRSDKQGFQGCGKPTSRKEKSP